MSNPLGPHGLQHARSPCPLPSPEFAKVHVHGVGGAIQLSHPLPPSSPFAFSVSQGQGFSSELALHMRWPEFCSFSLSLSNEYSGLVSFKIDWLDLLAIQGTLKSLLQHHHSEASVLRHSVFFMVQLTSSHDYWKNHSSGPLSAK